MLKSLGNHLWQTAVVQEKSKWRFVGRWVQQVHQDQTGSISIASVFSFIFLTMVLGMVINIGRHADRKIKIQNAADSTTFTGGVVVARSMNTLAFTNHLLCDVFGLTAYLREARDRNAESLVDPILKQWDGMAPEFADAPLSKFSQLAGGIPRKTPLERQLITVFSDQNAAISEQLLPVMESILEEEMIPEFQRALVAATPQLANEAANEIASRHGPVNSGLNAADAMMGLMWRTDGMPFGSATQTGLPQMPVSDPLYDITQYRSTYFQNGVRQREYASQRYLSILNRRMLIDFDARICGDGRNGVAKMSQFSNLWRGFTRGYLKQLLEVEHPFRNIPYQLRIDPLMVTDRNQYLENDYMFVGAVYWKPMEERMPGLFSNPLNADSMAIAQCHLFLPRPRLIKDLWLPPDRWIHRRWVPTHRDLMNQNWTIQLVPATSESMPSIVQTIPPDSDITTPNLGGLSVDDFRRLNTH